jgi:NhaP-type Na+/H+ or K+/H+ antiporter
MFARLTAKAILTAAAIAMAFFGIGLLGMALAAALVAALGTVGGYAVAGAVLLVPPLVWAMVTHLSRPQKQPAPINNELTRVLLAAVAKETPWIAIVGAGLAAAANMFLNRNKSPK